MAAPCSKLAEAIAAIDALVEALKSGELGTSAAARAAAPTSTAAAPAAPAPAAAAPKPAAPAAQPAAAAPPKQAKKEKAKAAKAAAATAPAAEEDAFAKAHLAVRCGPPARMLCLPGWLVWEPARWQGHLASRYSCQCMHRRCCAVLLVHRACHLRLGAGPPLCAGGTSDLGQRPPQWQREALAVQDRHWRWPGAAGERWPRLRAAVQPGPPMAAGHAEHCPACIDRGWGLTPPTQGSSPRRRRRQ